MMANGHDVKRILVTGGAGFIGANFVRYVYNHFPEVAIVNLDKLTYAGNRENLRGVRANHTFVHGDIQDFRAVRKCLEGVDVVVNFAAETHVDRSIANPGDFIKTDVFGVYVLLECVRQSPSVKLFLHISTDEVYGSIPTGAFDEESPLNPSSPYSASKAGGDRLTYSYFRTFGVPVIIVRPANNYGPYQYPEKLIPLFVIRALEGLTLPVYGDGKNRRDWLFVEDTVQGLLTIMAKGVVGEVYNMGAGQEMQNIQVTRMILNLLGKPESLITFVGDRAGHDFRYAVKWDKLLRLGWRPEVVFAEGLRRTVNWYVDQRKWWEKILKSREFRAHLRRQYA